MKKLSFIIAIVTLCASSVAFAGRGANRFTIRHAIDSGNADVIITELERAERLVCATCVDDIMPLLDNSDYRIREVAAWWFARRAGYKSVITMQSLARLVAGDPTDAAYAADILGTFRHPAVVPALAGALDRNFPAETRTAVVRAIGTIGDPTGEPALVKALGDGAAETRAEATRSYLALRGTRSGDPVVPLLSDGDVAVRRQAASAVGNLRTANARAGLEALLASDPDPIVRRNAAWALGRIGGSRAALERAASSDSITFVRSVAKAGLSSVPATQP